MRLKNGVSIFGHFEAAPYVTHCSDRTREYLYGHAAASYVARRDARCRVVVTGPRPSTFCAGCACTGKSDSTPHGVHAGIRRGTGDFKDDHSSPIKTRLSEICSIDAARGVTVHHGPRSWHVRVLWERGRKNKKVNFGKSVIFSNARLGTKAFEIPRSNYRYRRSSTR